MKKILLIAMLLVFLAVPAFAGSKVINVGSTSSVQVTSWNYGNGGSFAIEGSRNLATAGYTSSTTGSGGNKQVTVTTNAFSTGGTFGFAIGGYVQGFQSGYGSATITK
jgi:hypothetical protein